MMPPRSSKRILRIVLLSLTSSSPCAGANAPLPALAFVPLNNLQLVEQTTASFAAKSPLQNRRVCRCSLNGAHPPSRRREYLSRLASIGGRKNRTSGRRSIGVSTGLGLPARKTWRKLSTTTPMLDNDEGTVQSIQPDCDGGNRGSTSKNKTPNLAAYWDMLRPHNVPASFGLVAAGALAASHRIATILDPKVLLTAWAAASVAMGSCVLNDWFDMDIDRVNKPDRPLVTGEVVPEHALAIGMVLLLGALASAWAVHPAALQATIAASVGLTSAYTPVLKPIPVVKNLVVAGVVAAAIASGGLASGTGIAATLSPSLLTFFTIAYREILMDVSDVEGDRAAGVRTIPVLLGRESAMAIASALLTAGVVAGGAGILSGDATNPSRYAAAGLSALFAAPSYANVLLVVRSGFSQERLSSAVDQALGPLALTLGLMGIALR
ncbi:unnamed protein product [Ascophyllum nodosum]